MVQNAHGEQVKCDFEGNDPAALTRHRQRSHNQTYGHIAAMTTGRRGGTFVMPSSPYREWTVAAPNPMPALATPTVLVAVPGQTRSFTYPPVPPPPSFHAGPTPEPSNETQKRKAIPSLDDYIQERRHYLSSSLNSATEHVPCSFTPSARSPYFPPILPSDDTDDDGWSSEDTDECFYPHMAPLRPISNFDFDCDYDDTGFSNVYPVFSWKHSHNTAEC